MATPFFKSWAATAPLKRSISKRSSLVFPPRVEDFTRPVLNRQRVVLLGMFQITPAGRAMQIDPDSPIGSQLLTDKKVAERFNVSVRTVIDWRNAGKIPFIRLGRSIRYRRESIDALLEKLEISGVR